MILIRPAGAEDRIAVRALLDIEHRHYSAEGLPEADQERMVADILDRQDCRMLLALEEGQPVGFATYVVLHPSTNGRGTLFLKDLFVTGSGRGRGTGRRLMAELARIARQRGCSRFDWTTETDNPGAMRLYDRLGGRRVEDKVYYRVDAGELTDFIARCEG